MLHVFRDRLAHLDSLWRRLAVRFDRSRLESTEAMIGFVQTRSSYVSQTALYGYLKTRMGTSYRDYFEDEVFSESIRIAAVRVFLSCLADLTVFSVATVGVHDRLKPDELAALARHCFRTAAARGLADQAGAPQDILEAFDRRTGDTIWPAAAEGNTAFASSEGDVIRFAPVIDEYKDLDREIVTNSIRFRWRDVRVQARARLDPEAISRDWRILAEASRASPESA